jgi:hypothetical protein
MKLDYMSVAIGIAAGYLGRHYIGDLLGKDDAAAADAAALGAIHMNPRHMGAIHMGAIHANPNLGAYSAFARTQRGAHPAWGPEGYEYRFRQGGLSKRYGAVHLGALHLGRAR